MSRQFYREICPCFYNWFSFGKKNFSKQRKWYKYIRSVTMVWCESKKKISKLSISNRGKLIDYDWSSSLVVVTIFWRFEFLMIEKKPIFVIMRHQQIYILVVTHTTMIMIVNMFGGHFRWERQTHFFMIIGILKINNKFRVFCFKQTKPKKKKSI